MVMLRRFTIRSHHHAPGVACRVHGKRELPASSQLHMLAAETPHHVPEQLSDLALRLLAA